MDSITKVCKKCGIEKQVIEFKKDKRKKLFISATCQECANEYNRKYQKENKETINAKTKRRYYRDVERAHERVRSYYKENKEKVTEKAKIYNKENPEKIALKAKKWRDANKEEIRNQHNIRRVREKSVERSLSKEEWNHILESYNNKCVYCGKNANTQDHLVPISKGGGHTDRNVVPACRSCNSKKNSSSLLMFLYRLLKG